MKVIVIGYSKTGTKSMHVALKKLGYKVYDYEHNFFYLRKEWIKIMTREGGTKEDFYNMYKDVDATMDIPACVFWREILEAFPDAKLIFNDRKSVEDWWISWDKTAKNIADNTLMTSLAFFSPTGYSIFNYSRHVGRVAFGAPPQRFWQTFRGISPTVGKLRYRCHNADVREYMKNAPEGKLLNFHPSQGWEPLCEFLGKPIPDFDFPHKNKGGTVVDELLNESPIFHQMKREAVVLLAILVVILAVVLMNYLF